MNVAFYIRSGNVWCLLQTASLTLKLDMTFLHLERKHTLLNFNVCPYVRFVAFL